MSRERFVERATSAVASLPDDMKALLRVVEDADIDDESRILVAGALLHVLSAANAIPGMRGILQHVGDALVMRLVLEQVAKRSSEALGKHQDGAPDLLGELDEFLSIAREYLGPRIEVLEHAASGCHKLQHQGHNAKECALESDECDWLYDAVHAAIVQQFEFDEEEIVREMKQVDRIRGALELRVVRS